MPRPAFQKQLIILAASIFECLGVLKDTKNKEPKLQVTLHNLGLSFSVPSSDVTWTYLELKHGVHFLNNTKLQKTFTRWELTCTLCGSGHSGQKIIPWPDNDTDLSQAEVTSLLSGIAEIWEIIQTYCMSVCILKTTSFLHMPELKGMWYQGSKPANGKAIWDTTVNNQQTKKHGKIHINSFIQWK